MESEYLTPLWLEDLDGDNWILASEFIYYSELLNGIIKVPIRTETDLASVPLIFRGLLPKSGKYNKAAVLHDTGYHGQLVTSEGVKIHLVKHLCDQLFREAMLVSGVSDDLANFMYQVVVEFGVYKN